MAPKYLVDVGVACSANQTPQWWEPLTATLLREDRTDDIEIHNIVAVGSAMPDHNKNRVIELYRQGDSIPRQSKTDTNRNKIANIDFLTGGADWLWFIDDDTPPPHNALSQLLEKRCSFIAGAYFDLGADSHHPIAYIREGKYGWYMPVQGYADGALMQVDSVGMGCTLIHKSVFEKIQGRTQRICQTKW